MIPIGDDNSDRKTKPFVTWAIIAVNILVFALFQGFGGNEVFTNTYSLVPAEITSGHDVVTRDSIFVDPSTHARYKVPGLQRTPIPVYLTLIISMFMHAGIAHIVGNMLYLFIFGDNVEDRLGHARFLLFYLFCGIAAGLSHVLVTSLTGADPLVPCLGASGAISGVLGAYMLLFPKKRVRVLLFRFIVPVPAVVAIGFWFVFQIVDGLGLLGGGSGGVAYGAHVGGFIAGFATVKLWALGRRAAA